MQVRKSSPAITTDVEIPPARALPYKQEIIALLQFSCTAIAGQNEIKPCQQITTFFNAYRVSDLTLIAQYVILSTPIALAI